jgi:hypothetical protein
LCEAWNAEKNWPPAAALPALLPDFAGPIKEWGALPGYSAATPALRRA